MTRRCAAGCPRRLARWPTCTAAAGCTATSSRPTCCCAPTARWCWPTSATRCRAGSAGPAPPGTLVGSPRYAAPEQSQGAPAAPAADVYSLGVLLHEWLTGRPPFGGETPAEALAQHLLVPIPRLPAARAQWQPLLDALLAKDPARRLPDGQAVLTRNAT